MKTNLSVFKILLLMLVTGLLLMPGCKKSNPLPIDDIYHMWTWVQSSGGLAGGIHTPDSVGYTQAIRFTEGGQFTRYQDGNVTVSGTFTIERQTSLLDNVEYEMIIYNDGTPPQAIIAVSSSTLTIRDDCIDCGQHIYSR